ncbi:MAG: alpha-L-arabinofuranosidase C-terminal domain-containing protein [Nitrososphaerota archaeon]
MGDALFTGLVLIKLQKISRMVPIACFAQTVNVLPLISTRDDGAIVLSPRYHVYALYSPNAGRVVAWTNVGGPTLHPSEVEEPVQAMDAVATLEGDKMFLHLANGMPDEPVEYSIRVKGFDFGAVEHRYLASSSPDDRTPLSSPIRLCLKRVLM